MATINNRFENLTLERLQEIYDLIVSTPTSVSWGSITGTLALQTDLQIALNGKFSNPTGTVSEYIRGDGTLASFPSLGLTVFSTPITNGAVGRILFEGAGNVLRESANLFWDNTNARLGIGTTTPAYSISHLGTIGVASFFTQRDFGFNAFAQIATRAHYIAYTTDGNNGIAFGANGSGGSIQGFTGTVASPSAKALILQQLGGNLLIGTTTDAGFKLDVNGTVRVSGLTRSTDVFVVGGAATTNTANTRFWSAGGQAPTAVGLYRSFFADIAWIPSSGSSEWYGLDLRPTINQTGTANGVTRGLYIAPTLTAAADWRAIEVTNGITILGAATTAKASLRIPSGTAPTSPVNGDIWFDGTDIKMRIGGVTKTFTLI
jgi:hypothetical protein